MSGMRRRAVVVLHEEAIHRLLRLPDNMYVVGVRDDFVRNSILVAVESEELKEVPPMCEAPIIRSHLEYDEVLDVFRIVLEEPPS